MPDRAKITELRQRLAEERGRVVLTAASATTLPPAKFLSYLADLDGSLAAVEPYIDEDRNGAAVIGDQATSTAMN